MSLKLNSKNIAKIVMRVVERLNFDDIVAVRDVCNTHILQLQRLKQNQNQKEWNNPRIWSVYITP